MELFKSFKDEEKIKIEGDTIEEKILSCFKAVSNTFESQAKLLKIACEKIVMLEMQVQTLEMKIRKDNDIH